MASVRVAIVVRSAALVRVLAGSGGESVGLCGIHGRGCRGGDADGGKVESGLFELTTQIDGGTTQEPTCVGFAGDHRQRDLFALDVQACFDFAETGQCQTQAGLPLLSAIVASAFGPAARVLDLPLDVLAGPDLSLPGKVLRREGLKLLLHQHLRLLGDGLGGLGRRRRLSGLGGLRRVGGLRGLRRVG